MKLITLIIATLLGGGLGGLLGFFIPAVVCSIHDFITKAGTGGGWIAVGWLFCIATVPVGAIIGGSLGFLFALNPRKYIKRRIQPEAPLYGDNAHRFD